MLLTAIKRHFSEPFIAHVRALKLSYRIHSHKTIQKKLQIIDSSLSPFVPDMSLFPLSLCLAFLHTRLDILSDLLAAVCRPASENFAALNFRGYEHILSLTSRNIHFFISE